MPTIITRYLDTSASAGGDGTSLGTAYKTMPAALSDILGDFGSFTASDVLVQLYCSGGDDTLSANPTAWNSTTDATRYLEIFFTGSYRLVQSNSFWSLMSFATKKVVLHSVNLLHTGSRTNDARGIDFGTGASGGWYEIDGGKIICTGTGTPSGLHQSVRVAGTANPTVIYRNLEIGGWGTGPGLNSGFGGGRTTVVDNCTVRDCTTGIRVRRVAGDTFLVRNNIAYGNGTDYSVEDSGGTFTHSNNLSADATSPDAALQSQVLTFNAAGSGDYRLAASDVVAIGGGTDLSADTYGFTTDALGTTRRTPWSLGAYEYIGAAFSHSFRGRDILVDAAASKMANSIVDWHWEFGDGDESCGEFCDHTYVGDTISFDVTLTVTDTLGNTSQATASVAPSYAYYIATTGTSGGTGSISDPLSFSAWAAGGVTHDEVYHGFPPTDTVTFWVRGGTYSLANQTVDREGTVDHPYYIRPYPGEHVIIEGRLNFAGTYQVLQGDFEYRSPDPETTTDVLVDVHGDFNQVLGGIFHDSGASGVGVWDDSDSPVVADCVVYNNGNHTNQDHGIYINGPTNRYLRGNIIFNNWAYGVHHYSITAGWVSNLYADWNISFNNGHIADDRSGNFTRPDLFSGGSNATNLNWTNNKTWRPDDGENTLDILSDVTGGTNTDLQRTGNYLVGGVTVATFTGTVDQTGNTEYDSAAPPTSGTDVFVRASTDLIGLGQIVVYNWDDVGTVDVDVSSILRRGDSYAIYEAQDILGSAVASGTWDGASNITLPLAEVVVPDPIGRSFTTPPTTGTTFHAFVVRRTAQSYVAPTSSQVAYPASDVSVSGWTTNTGATTGLAATLADQSDTTWIESTTEDGDVVEVQLDAIDWPEQGDVTITLRHRGT